MTNLLPVETLSPEVQEAVADLVQNPFDGGRLIRLALILVSCLVIMKFLLAMLNRVIVKLKVERSLHTFIKSSVRILLWFITLLIMAESLGFPVGSLLGVLGIIGLALSLAIQGILSNLAGGIMILISKPFIVGDYIETGSTGGTIHDIGMVYTQIKTVDNKIIFVPNGEIVGEKIINYTNQETRRVDLKFSASYDSRPETVKNCIQAVIQAHPKALFTPEPFVRVSGYLDSSIEYTVRVWCTTADYWDLYYDLLEQVKAAFDRAGVEMSYPHLNVHMVGEQNPALLR